jgi:hypothetical protein
VKCSRLFFNPSDGSAQELGRGSDRDFLGINDEFRAESAADVWGHDADTIFVEAEHRHDEESGFGREL